MTLAEQRRALRGKLEEHKDARVKLEAEIANQMLILNAKANPFLDELTELETERLLAAATALHEKVTELRGLNAKISALQKELL